MGIQCAVATPHIKRYTDDANTNTLIFTPMGHFNFGIYFDGDERFNTADVAARLFLCPSIPVKSVMGIITKLKKKEVSIDKFYTTTDKYIEELKLRIGKDEHLAETMEERYKEWSLAHFQLTEDEIKFIQEHYDISDLDIGVDWTAEYEFKDDDDKEEDDDDDDNSYDDEENEDEDEDEDNDNDEEFDKLMDELSKELFSMEQGQCPDSKPRDCPPKPRTNRNGFPICNSAKELAEAAKQYIKGQDEAIERLAVPFFQHLDSARKGYTCKIKSSVMMMGPTGVGKSELLKIMGQLCDCPVIFINTSEVRPQGWKGIHITDMIARELNNGISLERLKYAIIVLDEADKITKHGCHQVSDNGTDESFDMMRDVMKLLDCGYSLHLENGMDMSAGTPRIEELPVDNLLVVFNGAFSGLEKIIANRLNIAQTIGFVRGRGNEAMPTNIMQQVCTADLEQWGYMPELLGRIGEVIVMNPLSCDTMVEIMMEAKDNILSSHLDYANRSNIELRFTDDALRLIAEEAQKSGLGFRNVKTLLSKTLNRLYYEMPAVSDEESPRVVDIDREYVFNRLSARH